MRRFMCITLLIGAAASAAVSQNTDQEKAQNQRVKIETILRIKDSRTVHDNELIGFLSDPDPVVRDRAVFAYGSMQDTTVLSMLVEHFQHDEDVAVQRSAVFAIGQTAGLLSKPARDGLQHDIIWSRMENSTAQAEMIEELGKFGSTEALRDLMLKFGEVHDESIQSALTMSTARFAIRSVTLPTATTRIVARVISGRAFTWREMYALQRIGLKAEVRSEIEKITPLFQHPDPLVRMNLAVLLGKVKDESTCLVALQKLAEFESDWRVRVAALKALGNFHLTKLRDALVIFKKALNDTDPYIALTALTALGNADINIADSSKEMKSLRSTLEHVAENESGGYRWQIQGEAAIAYAKLAGASALPHLDPKVTPQRLLRAQLLNAAGLTGEPGAMEMLKRFLDSDDKMDQRAALEGMQELAQKNSRNADLIRGVRTAAQSALSSGDVAVVTTAASILGDSLFADPSSTRPLLEKLAALRIPDDIEAMQEVISSLGKLKSREAVKFLEEELKAKDRSIVLASASALKEITGKSYDSQINLRFEPLHSDLDFAYLRSIPDVVHVRMETIRGDITMDFYKGVAPFTVMEVLKLATRQGFYRGLTFHRVVPTFVVQGGDPRGDGWGGPGFSIRSEFSPLSYEEGTVGVASAGKDTEGSQFFIAQTPQPHLDGRYTIFGKVTSGMDVVNKIQIDDRIFDLKVIP